MAEIRRLILGAPFTMAWADYDPEIADECLAAIAAMPVTGPDPVDPNRWACAHLILLSRAVVAWDLVDQAGEPVPIEWEAIAELPFSALGVIIGAIIADQWVRQAEGVTS